MVAPLSGKGKISLDLNKLLCNEVNLEDSRARSSWETVLKHQTLDPATRGHLLLLDFAATDLCIHFLRLVSTRDEDKGSYWDQNALAITD